jgi:hypothetical protein
MYIGKGITAQPIPQRWFGLTGSMRLDSRFWMRVAEKLVKAGHRDFAAADDETVKRAIALVEGEDARHKRMVMIERVINGTPPGHKRPPPRKAITEGRRDGKHQGLGPAPVVLNKGIRDTGPERTRYPKVPARLLRKPEKV